MPSADNIPDTYIPTVADVMSHTLVTIDASASLAEARAQLHQHGVHHLLVTTGGHVVAVLSDRDLLRSLSPFLGTITEQSRDTHTLLRPVFQIATYHPVMVRSDTPVYEAALLLLDHGISCLPATDATGRVAGVVTTRDLVRGLLACSLPYPASSPGDAAA